MKYSQAGNAILPNTFQHPNIFVDRLMFYLTPSENVVLTFAVRRILGFQSNIASRKDNISLSQFTDGLTADDGTPKAYGCGLGTQAVINALETLEQFKILVPTTVKADPRKGQEYWLQENESAIDWSGLEDRKTAKKDKFKRQTKKARRSVKQNPSVEQTPSHTVEQTARPLLNRYTKPTETQRNPIGAHAPMPIENMPVDWQMAAGVKTIVIPDQEQAKRMDFANLVAVGTPNPTVAREIALTFQNEKNITLPTDPKKVNGQRKAITEMLGHGVTPRHVMEAVRKLLTNRMTFTDLFGVAKTAIDLATQPQGYGSGSHAL